METQQIQAADTERLVAEAVNRNRTIVRTSITGIAANVLLAAFKAVIGLITNSIAVTLDAVNNLSDAFSSVITIIGTKLGAKRPDRKHPLGYGRIEYMSALIVSAIVLYAGITSAVESVKKIIHPETADYSTESLIIIAAAVVVKIILGGYVKKQGEKVNSGALVASGEDARFDAILSFSVLVSAIIFLVTGLSLEAFVGVVISLFIIKSGVEMMRDTLDDILGKRADADMTKQIKKVVTSFPDVKGAYDLNLYDYGPERTYATVHMELPDTMTVDEVDLLTRRIQYEVYHETGVVLTGVSVYSFNTQDEEAAAIRREVAKIVKRHLWVLQMHGFYADTQKKTIRFDAVLSFDIDPKDGIAILCKEIAEVYPDYTLQIVPDVDVSDL